MRRTAIYAGAGALAAVLLLLLTPAGVYLLARVVEQAAPRHGWKVEIGSTGGSLLGKPRFEEVHAAERSGSPSISARSLAGSVWDREVVVDSPRIEIDLSQPDSVSTSEPDPAPPPVVAPEPPQYTLPLDDIPSITVSGAELVLHDDSLRVLAKGIDLRFGTTADSPQPLRLRQAAAAHGPGYPADTRGDERIRGARGPAHRRGGPPCSGQPVGARNRRGRRAHRGRNRDSRTDRIPSPPSGNRLRGALSKPSRGGRDNPVRVSGGTRPRGCGRRGVE